MADWFLFHPRPWAHWGQRLTCHMMFSLPDMRHSINICSLSPSSCNPFPLNLISINVTTSQPNAHCLDNAPMRPIWEEMHLLCPNLPRISVILPEDCVISQSTPASPLDPHTITDHSPASLFFFLNLLSLMFRKIVNERVRVKSCDCGPAHFVEWALRYFQAQQVTALLHGIDALWWGNECRLSGQESRFSCTSEVMGFSWIPSALGGGLLDSHPARTCLWTNYEFFLSSSLELDIAFFGWGNSVNTGMAPPSFRRWWWVLWGIRNFLVMVPFSVPETHSIMCSCNLCFKYDVELGLLIGRETIGD